MFKKVWIIVVLIASMMLMPTQAQDTITRFEGAFQPFEGGYMMWWASTGGIWVLHMNGTTEYFDQSQYENLPNNPLAPTIMPPENRYVPISGFGRIWGNFDHVRTSLGFGLQPETAYVIQRENLALVGNGAIAIRVNFPNGREVLLRDNNTWTAYLGDVPTPTPAPNDSILMSQQVWYDAQMVFDYPADWYVREEARRIVITTFDPNNRPAMAAWTPNTMEMELRFVRTSYASLQDWVDTGINYMVGVEIHDGGQVTLANGSPAIKLDIVSGSGHSITNYYAMIDGKQIFISFVGSDTVANQIIGTLVSIA